MDANEWARELRRLHEQGWGIMENGTLRRLLGEHLGELLGAYENDAALRALVVEGRILRRAVDEDPLTLQAACRAWDKAERDYAGAGK